MEFLLQQKSTGGARHTMQLIKKLAGWDYLSQLWSVHAAMHPTKHMPYQVYMVRCTWSCTPAFKLKCHQIKAWTVTERNTELKGTMLFSAPSWPQYHFTNGPAIHKPVGAVYSLCYISQMYALVIQIKKVTD